ncbi:MAG: GTP cyclohydrolase FolE2 [Gammaproteobacteria bacterium]
MKARAAAVLNTIPDTQRCADTRRVPIDKVGIKGIVHPVLVASRSGATQHSVARLNLYVNLRHDVKGAHMSRFVAQLNSHERELTVSSFKAMLADMTRRLEAEAGYIEMRFPYFVAKSAPVSNAESLMNYEVTFRGELVDGKPRVWVQLTAPVTSLCPCSKSVADYGAHSQRAHLTVCVRTDQCIWIEDLIELVERQASCELYGLLKRPDEKYVTERAYDNPKFVEDVVRDIAIKLNADERVLAYTVEAENFESIHNHSAYAKVVHDKHPQRRGGAIGNSYPGRST